MCEGKGVMLPASLAYPNGEPALVGRYTAEMKCARCKMRIAWSPADFAVIPDVVDEGFSALAQQYGTPRIAEIHTKDLVGAGFARHEAVDLYHRGVLGAEAAEGLPAEHGHED